MANFLERLVQEGKKRKKQIQRNVTDVFSADTEEDQKRRMAAGQPRYYAQQQKQLRNPSNDAGIARKIVAKNPAGFGAAMGIGRSITGGLQAASGLVDLASPGTGTSRFSKFLDRTAQSQDNQARRLTGNSGFYKFGQGIGDTVQMAAGSGIAKVGGKAIEKTPLVGRQASKVLPTIERGIERTTNPLTQSRRAPIRIAGNTVKGAVNPRMTASNVAGTAYYTGKEASRGRDINPKSVGVQLGLQQAGIPAAGAIAREIPATVRVAAPVAKNAKYNYDKLTPGVRELDNQYSQLNQRWQTANPQTRRQLEAAIASNRQARRDATQLGIGGSTRRVDTSKSTPTQPIAPPQQPPTIRLRTASEPQLPAPKQGTQLAASGDSSAVILVGSAVAIPKKGKQTRYASKTVPESEFVSDQIKKDVRTGAPLYDVQTERQRYTDSLARLKNEGDDTFEVNLRERLNAPNGKIGSQDVADAQTIAAILDAKGDQASLQKATDIYQRLSEHLTAAGQTVQAASILSRRTPQGLRYWATKQLREGGVEITPEMSKTLTKLIDETKTAADKERAVYNVTKLVNDAIPSSRGDRFINAWRAGLLTSPVTTMGNIAGNTGEALVRKGFVNPVASGADALMSLVTGRRTQTLAPLGSGTEGAAVGASKLPDFISTGFDERDALSKYEGRQLNYGAGPVGRALNAYVNGTYRLMSVADQPYWYSAQRNSLGSIAKSEAINRGLKGMERSNFVEEFLNNPPDAALERSVQEAAYATFQNETGLGKAAVAFKDGLNKITPGLGDFIVPFTQVPASIATRVITRTPVGTAIEVVKQFKRVRDGRGFDQRALAQSIGEGAFGAAVLGAGYALANSGALTFGYPQDARERKLWEAEGKQPYSVKVGDRWYSLNYLQPFGALLAVGAKAGEQLNNGESLENALSSAAATAGQSVANQSFVKGISGAIDAITDPERSVSKFVNQSAASAIPNLIRAGTRAFDPQQREEAGLVQGVMQGIPGLRGMTSAKTDTFGQPLNAKDNPVNQLLNPLRPSIARENNPTAKEARRLQDAGMGVLPSQINKTSLGKDTEPLSKEQINELQSKVGYSVNNAWKELIATDAYKNMSDEDKATSLKSLSGDILDAEKRRYSAEKGIGRFADSYAGEDKKPSEKVSAILQGQLDVSNYITSSGKKDNVIKDDARGTALLTKVNSLSNESKKEWLTKAINDKFKDVYERSKGLVPKDFPELPETNATLDAYATYLKVREKNPSALKLNSAKKDFLKSAYKSGLTDSGKELLGNYSVDEKIGAIENGDISKEDLDNVVAYDNMLINLGLASSPKISNTIRKYFGLERAPKGKSGGKGGKGGGRSKITPSDFALPTDILTKYALRGANLAANAKIGS